MHKKIKTTITLSKHIKEFATQEAESLGLDFSAYITVLIAEKLRGYNVINPITKITAHTIPTIKLFFVLFISSSLINYIFKNIIYFFRKYILCFFKIYFLN